MIKDGPAQGPAAAVVPEGLVAVESAAADDEGGAVEIGDGPAMDLAPIDRVTDTTSLIVRQDVVDERQGTAVVENASSFDLGGQTIIDRQPGDGDGNRLLVLADVKDPAVVVAADGQHAGAGPLDVQALADGQLAAGQGDRLAIEAGGEHDRIAIASVLDRVSQ